ncbi:hypothetical protein [Desulfosarcina ovata]|uniref:Uncharacterized protein n=2 Tax=Desulfosarcina ovata TaxID=83564 RepID=A0A5K8ADM3_9BACT|nr:hypothetical protein [Desulfosarcina ovata]BBO83580.1 hypothetical protein DSCO28_41460 [Desulfosarcina ovata subsp. sediminis]BBO90040.1 hypothetical protein DSCOOX_32200 [Desulfosarcina ovata subsp. ovata]
MKAPYDSVPAGLEASVLHFFSPSGLLTVITLVILSVMIFSTSTIEHRAYEHKAAGYQTQQQCSPLLTDPR